MKSCRHIKHVYPYIDGDYSVKKRRKLEKHFVSCDICRRTMAIAIKVKNEAEAYEWELLSDYETQLTLNELKPNKTQKIVEFFEHINSMTGSLINDAIQSFQMLKYQPVRVRSFAPVRSLTHSSIKQNINDLSIELITENYKNDVLLKVIIDQTTNKANNIRLTLIDTDNCPVASSPLRGQKVCFQHIQFDNYQLIIKQNEQEKGVLNFVINEEGIYDRTNHLS